MEERVEIVVQQAGDIPFAETMASVLAEKGQLHVALERENSGGRRVEDDMAEGLNEVVTSSIGYIDGSASVPQAFLETPGDICGRR